MAYSIYMLLHFTDTSFKPIFAAPYWNVSEMLEEMMVQYYALNSNVLLFYVC